MPNPVLRSRRMAEELAREEQAALAPYFTNLTGPVFALVNLPEVVKGALRDRYVATLGRAFDLCRTWLPKLRAFFEAKFPRDAAESETVYRMTIRAKALDTLRGMLPAATTSNVGIYATGQAYEQLLLRMRAHPLREVRDCADLMLVELRKVIPAFLKRVDVPERGGIWSTYFEETRRDTRDVARRFVPPDPAGGQRHADLGRAEEVMLTDFDPDGEAKVVAAALYAASSRPDAELLEIARRMTPDERNAVLAAYVGKRLNRRHRPGRAFERTSYRFDVLGDYGAFRDLQRHRLLTLQLQRLSPRHGYVTPDELREASGPPSWTPRVEGSQLLPPGVRAAAPPC